MTFVKDKLTLVGGVAFGFGLIQLLASMLMTAIMREYEIKLECTKLLADGNTDAKINCLMFFVNFLFSLGGLILVVIGGNIYAKCVMWLCMLSLGGIILVAIGAIVRDKYIPQFANAPVFIIVVGVIVFGIGGKVSDVKYLSSRQNTM